MAKKFYITTPIYYVNARPHIGHAYTTIACDSVARRQRMMGSDTYFLTGTDEHGQKIERAAQAAGKTPQQLTDEVSAEFRALWDRMGLTYDDYIRTTPIGTSRGSRRFGNASRQRPHLQGDTPASIASSMRCTLMPAGRALSGVRPDNRNGQGRELLFQTSAFQDRLLQLYSSQPDFIRPETRRNEVISFVRSGLRDLSVSRSTFSWGIPVPDDPKHVIYVWLDALANYITALGYGSDDPARYAKYLARRFADDRQRDRPLPLRLLAGISDGRRSATAERRSSRTAGCCLKRTRCRSRAAISCARRRFSKSGHRRAALFSVARDCVRTGWLVFL